MVKKVERENEVKVSFGEPLITFTHEGHILTLGVKNGEWKAEGYLPLDKAAEIFFDKVISLLQVYTITDGKLVKIEDEKGK